MSRPANEPGMRELAAHGWICDAVRWFVVLGLWFLFLVPVNVRENSYVGAGVR